ncbi:unnamed protein product [Meloidogyne enterolobii]|uniref:Uncharacterized protein n=1 Tax=Meloidogyne enterolobii TaxID=390850 RepID=A0ACB0ZKQ4_MELEN
MNNYIFLNKMLQVRQSNLFCTPRGFQYLLFLIRASQMEILFKNFSRISTKVGKIKVS